MEWISVKDRLPKEPIDKRGYLCRYLVPRYNLNIAFYAVINFSLEGKPHFQITDDMLITHWMPLPKLPKERKESEIN